MNRDWLSVRALAVVLLLLIAGCGGGGGGTLFFAGAANLLVVPIPATLTPVSVAPPSSPVVHRQQRPMIMTVWPFH